MRIVAIALIALLVVNTCEAGALSDWFKKLGADLKNTFTNMGGELKEVGKALGDVGKDSLKSLASQSVQALGGALIESTKGFNLGEILFGKRGDMDFDTLIVDAVRDAEKFMDKILDIDFVAAIDNISKLNVDQIVDDIVEDIKQATGIEL